MTALLVALALAGADPDCVAVGDWPLDGFNEDLCPQVWQIHGSAPPDEALNIVVLADAFAEHDLRTFRCAAGLLFEQLALTPPFDGYADSINVYRIDLAASQSGVRFKDVCGGVPCIQPERKWVEEAEQCAELERSEKKPHPYRGKPVLPGDRPECVEIDIGSQPCPVSSPKCQLLWPEGDGIRKLWRVAACVPSFDVVLLLVNSQVYAGGGTNDLHPPLAVSTLVGIEDPDPTGGRGRLMMHELGHALGLLDEYSDAYSKEHDKEDRNLPPYHGERNVLIGSDGELPERIPWANVCSKDVENFDEFAHEGCFVQAKCGDRRPPRGQRKPAVGLYEGGFYQACGYYKASGICRMRKPEEAFCMGCKTYLRCLFDELGMRPDDGAPRPDFCLD